jgi:hypothetical protein
MDGQSGLSQAMVKSVTVMTEASYRTGGNSTLRESIWDAPSPRRRPSRFRCRTWTVLAPGLQATRCQQTPTWTGRWFSPKGDRWSRVWACPDHCEGLTRLRQFGG